MTNNKRFLVVLSLSTTGSKSIVWTEHWWWFGTHLIITMIFLVLIRPSWLWIKCVITFCLCLKVWYQSPTFSLLAEKSWCCTVKLRVSHQITWNWSFHRMLDNALKSFLWLDAPLLNFIFSSCEIHNPLVIILVEYRCLMPRCAQLILLLIKCLIDSLSPHLWDCTESTLSLISHLFWFLVLFKLLCNSCLRSLLIFSINWVQWSLAIISWSLSYLYISTSDVNDLGLALTFTTSQSITQCVLNIEIFW